MMKKFLCFSLVCVVLFLCGCSSKKENWKTINIENCGSLSIPNEWEYFVEDDVMYIVKDDSPIMISSKRSDENESNSYFHNYKYVDFSTSAVLSNGAMYGKAKYLYKNNQIELYYLNLPHTSDYETIDFIVWEESISEELLIEIAKTFSKLGY